ncbi:hypothetical protein RvY_02859 [Ramazzottius varieornatus]|uniref:Helitron helicase-like domain-containing protein n=1 Tax=Ramazzottius varieornatus TaxID=947166 RepID=A0A1D1UPX4_RAMVA|nr:hypothetical protein RvY_02859 [Ramazzottius varieornatus]
MSCNPKWPEIIAELLPGQTAADRPDITARVFHGKLAHLFELIPKALKCGKIIYRIHVIEFQKRGLPHAHISIKAQNEPKTAEEIDAVICACVARNHHQLKGIIEALYIHSCRPERCHKKQKTTRFLVCIEEVKKADKKVKTKEWREVTIRDETIEKERTLILRGPPAVIFAKKTFEHGTLVLKGLQLVEDFLEIIPGKFMWYTNNDISKHELKEWMDEQLNM